MKVLHGMHAVYLAARVSSWSRIGAETPGPEASLVVSSRSTSYSGGSTKLHRARARLRGAFSVILVGDDQQETSGDEARSQRRSARGRRGADARASRSGIR